MKIYESLRVKSPYSDPILTGHLNFNTTHFRTLASCFGSILYIPLDKSKITLLFNQFICIANLFGPYYLSQLDKQINGI